MAIRLESPGGAIYRQRRVGKGGRDFDLLKLRTMVSGAERMGAGLAVDEGDPRITRTGALLRRFSLDELPNLVNVLTGDMSLVGPRPTVRAQVEQYTRASSAASRWSPASPAGRRCPAARRCRGTSGSSSTSGTSSTGRCASTCASCCDGALLLSGKGLYRGETGVGARRCRMSERRNGPGTRRPPSAPRGCGCPVAPTAVPVEGRPPSGAGWCAAARERTRRGATRAASPPEQVRRLTVRTRASCAGAPCR